MTLEEIKKFVEESKKWDEEHERPLTEEEWKDLSDRMNS